MMTPKLLTIAGETLSMTAWSRRPGAARYHTIVNRLIHGWDHEAAVFTQSKGRGRPKLTGPKKPYRRLVGVNRPSRAMTERHQRPAVVLAPNPRQANPFPPCVGGFRSYPLEALELLRRCA